MPGPGVMFVFSGSVTKDASGRSKATVVLTKAYQVPDKQPNTVELQKSPTEPQPAGNAVYLAWARGGRPPEIRSVEQTAKVLGAAYKEEMTKGSLGIAPQAAAVSRTAPRGSAANPIASPIRVTTTVGEDGRVTTTRSAGGRL